MSIKELEAFPSHLSRAIAVPTSGLRLNPPTQVTTPYPAASSIISGYAETSITMEFAKYVSGSPVGTPFNLPVHFCRINRMVTIQIDAIPEQTSDVAATILLSTGTIPTVYRQRADQIDVAGIIHAVQDGDSAIAEIFVTSASKIQITPVVVWSGTTTFTVPFQSCFTYLLS